MRTPYAPVKFDIVIGEKRVMRGQLDVNPQGRIEDVQFGNQLCPITIQHALCDFLMAHLDQEFLKDEAMKLLPVGKIG